jgi:hypothetical protein
MGPPAGEFVETSPRMPHPSEPKKDVHEAAVVPKNRKHTRILCLKIKFH